jgi:hypothetical protein
MPKQTIKELTQKQWTSLVRLADYSIGLENIDKDLLRLEVVGSPYNTLEMIFSLYKLELIEVAKYKAKSESEIYDENLFKSKAISLSKPNDIVAGLNEAYKNYCNNRYNNEITYFSGNSHLYMGVWVRLTLKGIEEKKKECYEKYRYAFEPTFYSWKGIKDHNLVNLNGRYNLALELLDYFILGNKQQLPPIKIDEYAIDIINKCLSLTKDNVFYLNKEKDYISTLSMLSALSIWQIDSSIEYLEKKLLALDLKNITEQKEFINKPGTIVSFFNSSKAHSEKFTRRGFQNINVIERIEIILHYYLIAIASSKTITKPIETYILNIISEYTNFSERNANLNIQLIAYIGLKHYNQAIMQELKLWLEKHKDQLLKADQESHEIGVFASIFNVFAIHGNQNEIEELFELGKKLDKLWGNLYFLALNYPHRAELLYKIGNKYRKLRICSTSNLTIYAAKLCDRINQIAIKHEFIKNLEQKSTEEIEKELHKIDRKGKALQLWNILYPKNTVDNFPISNEIKFIRSFKKFDETIFKKALHYINELAVPVILTDGENECLGFETFEAQEDFLFKNKKVKMQKAYYADYWASPVQNACTQIMDSASNCIFNNEFPERFLKHLRLMLSIRKHYLWDKEFKQYYIKGSFTSYETNNFKISCEDNFYCQPKEIFPLLVEILRRNLIYDLFD